MLITPPRGRKSTPGAAQGELGKGFVKENRELGKDFGSGLQPTGVTQREVGRGFVKAYILAKDFDYAPKGSGAQPLEPPKESKAMVL